MQKWLLVVCALGALPNAAFGDIIAGTDMGDLSRVKTFENTSGNENREFLAYGPVYLGGARVAAGDLNGDSYMDIVTGEGESGRGQVKVFDGDTGNEMRSFLAYVAYSGDIFVGSGDINRDGTDDIVTGPGSDTSPQVQVKVFDGLTNTAIRSFFAYDPAFTGGVRVATGDLNGDGFADIITGAGDAGSGHVKVFDGSTGAELRSFLAYGAGYTGGVFVGGGDVNNDGFADIITGADSGATSHVKVFDGLTNAEIRSFVAYDPSFTGGVRVAAGDLNGDGFADIVTGEGYGGNGHIKVFDGNTGSENLSFLAYSPVYSSGVYVAGSILTVPEPSSVILAFVGIGIAFIWGGSRR